MIVKAIETFFQKAKQKEWGKTYWAFDIHRTIIRPNYKTNEIAMEFYSFAKEAMQLISQWKDIIKILYTCSYPNEIVQYIFTMLVKTPKSILVPMATMKINSISMSY